MRKISVAVCDTEQEYGKKLGEWISLEKGERLAGYSFSTLESFLEFQGKQQIDVVLLGTGFLENSQIMEQVNRCVKGQKEAEKDSAGVIWIWLYDSASAERLPEIAAELPVIEKYQAAPEIVREIFWYYQEYGKKEQSAKDIKQEIVGIYSPGHSIWQTPFALTLAQSFTRKGKVLYVNLKECAGFRGWLQESYQRDLLDVMYLCLTGKGNVSDCIRSSVYSLEGFDYIPPVEDGICLGETGRGDYAEFVKLISEKSGYDVMILDFGMMIPGFFDLLENCTHVYIPVEAGKLQEEAVHHFRQMTARQNRPQLEERISYIPLPCMEANLYQGEQRLQQWVWGELGDCARQLVGVSCGTN